MNRTFARLRGRLANIVLAASFVGVAGCEGQSGPDIEAAPDARLESHAVIASTPTAEGLDYLGKVAQAHRRADEAPEQAVEILREALAIRAPAKLGEAEILRLELAARLGETLLPERAREAREVLAEMVPTTQSLPIDRAAAHVLVVLGDAALAEGDDALAAGSYARAIRMMSLLRQELKQ